MTLKLDMQHKVREYYQHRSNYDNGLTLTYFKPMSNLAKEKVTIIYFSKTIAALRVGQDQVFIEFFCMLKPHISFMREDKDIILSP